MLNIIKSVKTSSNQNSIFRSLLIVPEGTEEWDLMWSKLSNHKLNKGLETPCLAENAGEVWEYMESTKCLFGYHHIFRHRFHPKTLSKEIIKIRSSYNLVINNHA